MIRFTVCGTRLWFGDDMAIVPMADAVAGEVAQSAEYNKLIDNIEDLNTRLSVREGTAVGATQNGSGTTSSVTYTPTLSGGTACAFSFVAPGSGAVLISNNCNLECSAGNLSLCSFEVRTGGSVGSGTVVLAASNDDALISLAQINIGRSVLLTGLTPGATYNIRQLFAVTGGTGTFKSKNLNVIPA